MGKFEEAVEEIEESTKEEKLRHEIYELKKKSQSDQKKNADLLQKLEIRDAMLDELFKEISLYHKDLGAQPKWLTEKRRQKKHRGTLVAMCSDTHIAEVVNPAEIGGYNKYNLEIAEARIKRFFERTILVSSNYLAGVTYDGIVLALGGDIGSGDIHDELVETNEISTYEMVETCVPWFASGIEYWLDKIGKVHVVSAPGNHGRNSQKPRHKKRSANNADTHISRLLAWYFDGDDRVTFNVPQSADVDFQVYDYHFSMEHGDNLKFNGTSEIGALGPVKRGNLRKTKKRQEQGKPFKYGLYGHFHQYVPAHPQGFIMNGSIKGYDEYASDGQFSPEPAQQALFVVTPEHGITVTTPVLVSDRDKEGW